MDSQEIKEYKNSMVGYLFRHFKGNLYVVNDIAVHTETGDVLVIYRRVGKRETTYARPLEMFLSEVDKDAYPDVKQKLRFKKVCLRS